VKNAWLASADARPRLHNASAIPVVGTFCHELAPSTVCQISGVWVSLLRLMSSALNQARKGNLRTRALLRTPGASSIVELVRLLPLPEVARRLNRNPVLVRRWLREGRLRGVKYGRDWLIAERDLARFRAEQPERRRRSGR